MVLRVSNAQLSALSFCSQAALTATIWQRRDHSAKARRQLPNFVNNPTSVILFSKTAWCVFEEHQIAICRRDTSFASAVMKEAKDPDVVARSGLGYGAGSSVFPAAASIPVCADPPLMI
jgi:hypothetical protein